ncbi:MAG: peptidoglycan bridge formation glycyltransferase FemA/FemB family protein [Candidatus Buchananbacteria bacterium]
MSIITVNDEHKQAWDDFVMTYAGDGGLLHAWDWGDFQKSLGNKIFRLALLDEHGNFQAAALLIQFELHFEYNYLYCPRGPVINILKSGELEQFFDEFKKIAGEQKSFLLRLDPAWPIGQENLLLDTGWRKGDHEVQPKCSFVINVSSSEEEILAQMKPKARYNIGLAKKHEVIIRQSCEISDIESFWQLTKQTAARDGFKPHGKDHYKKMFETLCPVDKFRVFLAEYRGQIIAAHLVAFFGDTATYLHGASSDVNREVMAPYLLQWAAILEAKKRGLKYYDFGGVNGKTYFNEKWEGITRFKTGFSQNIEPREYIGAYEMVLNPVIYSVYKFVKQIRG